MSKCNHCTKGQIFCQTCKGGSSEVLCGECSGLGYYADFDGKYRDCDNCGGDGYLSPDECNVCSGERVVDCLICDGEYHLLDGECNNCAGKGELLCFSCQGKGSLDDDGDELECEKCNGIGYEVCSCNYENAHTVFC